MKPQSWLRVFMSVVTCALVVFALCLTQIVFAAGGCCCDPCLGSSYWDYGDAVWCCWCSEFGECDYHKCDDAASECCALNLSGNGLECDPIGGETCCAFNACGGTGCPGE